MDKKITSLDDYRPHCCGNVICAHCVHEWTAVWPNGTTILECPNCGEMTTTDQNSKYKALYYDLIMQVQMKYPDETRHETASRYIRERAIPCPACRGDGKEHICHLQCGKEKTK